MFEWHLSNQSSPTYLSTLFGAILSSLVSPVSGLVKIARFLLPGQVVVTAVVPEKKQTVWVDSVEVVVETKKSLPARLLNPGATVFLTTEKRVKFLVSALLLHTTMFTACSDPCPFFKYINRTHTLT